MTEKKRPKTAAEAAEQDVEDLNTIHPDRKLEIGGQKVTVRPFGFVESLQLEEHTQAIIGELKRELLDRDDFDLTRVMGALGRQHEHFLVLVEVSTGIPYKTLEKLDDEDGMKLIVVFWQVHRDFFTRRLVMAASAEAAARQVNRARATAKSSPLSSGPVTDSTKSAGTPAPSSNSSPATPRG